MCKFALFILAAVAGVCLVFCQEKLSEACKPTLEKIDEGSKELMEDAPECLKAWKAKHNPSGVKNPEEYINALVRLTQVGNKEVEECGREAAPYMQSKMGEMIQMLDGVQSVYEENKECFKVIDEIGRCITDRL